MRIYLRVIDFASSRIYSIDFEAIIKTRWNQFRRR